MSTGTEKQTCENLSRRNLLKGAVLGVAGTAAVASGGWALSEAQAKSCPALKWPWPYEKLDPAKTAEIAHSEYYRLECGASLIYSVFSQLAEKIGDPYASFPVEAFGFLGAGIDTWGTICGANAGENIVTNLIIGPKTNGVELGRLMGSEIMQWYCDTALPDYVPKVSKVKAEIPKTVSNSPLCHVSVGVWMAAAKKPLGSPERKERCARLTASVAYKTVELLNAWKDGKYVTKGVFPAKLYHIDAQGNCDQCHGTNVPSPPMAEKTVKS
ncbi:MAG: C-GCAxxG-C-C family (seleno)protein [Syntrophobacteraceae bacterium]